ncbi:MAG: carboxypeptidase-like regulatory domain-containing protein [Candidatus Eremiobacteraeota bacterium]|nr:carboxypeptidase-like regulatory domain-containing protein [Candidatus Eremiobacteraeota bacterium]
MKNALYVAIGIIIAFCLALAGCGGGGGSAAGGGGIGGGGITPIPTVAPTAQPGAYGTSGYVYRSAGLRAGNEKLIVLPQATAPSGFIPAAGIVVQICSDPPLMQRTDSNGFFDFGEVPSSLLGDLSFPDVIVDDPGSSVPPSSYPMLWEPMESSQLTDMRIVPPWSETGEQAWSLVAGQVEWFTVVGRYQGEWHPVSDTITWSVSSANLGEFDDYGIFYSNSAITATATGTVTASFGGKSLTLTLKVLGPDSIGSLSGTVKDTKGNPAVNTIVQIMADTTSPNCSSGCAITDETGAYEITGIPFGTYQVEVYSLYGSSIVSEKVEINGKVVKNFTVSETAATLYATTSTDKIAYKPGETIKVQVALMNMGSSTTTFTYTAIKFDLVKTDFATGESTVISSVTTEGGTATVAGYGYTVTPETAASLDVPQSAPENEAYSIKTTFTASQALTVWDGFVIIGDEPIPYPMPEPTGTVEPQPYPTASPSTTSTTNPSYNDDKYYLGEIKSRLSSAYSDIYSYANRAYYGEDVSYYVNGGSNVQDSLKYCRNWLMPYLKKVSYSGWQSEIDSVLRDLDRYAYSGGTYSDLYSASNSLSGLISEVDQAYWSGSKRPKKLRRK